MFDRSQGGHGEIKEWDTLIPERGASGSSSSNPRHGFLSCRQRSSHEKRYFEMGFGSDTGVKTNEIATKRTALLHLESKSALQSHLEQRQQAFVKSPNGLPACQHRRWYRLASKVSRREQYPDRLCLSGYGKHYSGCFSTNARASVIATGRKNSSSCSLSGPA